MPRISEFSLQGIRCFGSAQPTRLARITLLVGENSVGKSTFLGCYSAFANLSNLVGLTEHHPFDHPPFFMGNYDTIARAGTSGFTIAGRYDDHIYSTARFSFSCDKKGQPLERRAEFSFAGKDDSPVCIDMSSGTGDNIAEEQLSFRGPTFEFSMDWSEISFMPISAWLSRNVRQGFLPYNADRATFKKRRGVPTTSEEVVEFNKFVNFFRSEMPLPAQPSFRVRALDPDVPPRQRSYNELPEYLSDSSDPALIALAGRELGLWDDIALTKSTSDDGAEVLVKTAAGSHNLLDVGYGVQSMLPLVHAIAAAEQPSIFLLQQPEVHIHPVAQAKLAQYMAEGRHDYIIETHSDHIVDRFRLCVKQQVLQPDDLMILYFEKNEDGSQSKIYNISVDSQGIVVNPPDTYREFFLTETERLLGLK